MKRNWRGPIVLAAAGALSLAACQPDTGLISELPMELIAEIISAGGGTGQADVEDRVEEVSAPAPTTAPVPTTVRSRYPTTAPSRYPTVPSGTPSRYPTTTARSTATTAVTPTTIAPTTAVPATLAPTTTAAPTTVPTTMVPTTTAAPTTTTAAPTTTTAAPTTTVAPSGNGSSDYLGSYTLDDAEFGTEVTVTVDGTTRTITANALPDHATGDFPTAGNPNTISAQSVSYSYPLNPSYTGAASEVRTTGVAVNGVKFEPGTAETVTCTSGGTLRVEALQDIYNLGLDFNNAHVQPTGEYHYHGASELLALAYSTDSDLVHVGFAADGYLIYYSKSGAYESGYALSNVARSGTGCTGSSALGGVSVAIDGTSPDGTYSSDWIHSATNGDLDSCNGTTIDGAYAYLLTDDYPYIGRCLNGEAAAEAGPGGGTGAGGPPNRVRPGQ